MPENQKILIDLGAVRLELSFEDRVALQRADPSESPLLTNRPVLRSSFAVGVMNYSRHDLEKYKSRNERVKVRVIGGFRLDDDISPDLAMDVVDSIRVIGVFEAMDAVKHALTQSGKVH